MKRITMLSPIQGGTAYGPLTIAGSPYTVDDAFAAELVNRAVAVFTDPPVPTSVYTTFVTYMTSAQFAQVTMGAAGVTYEVTDAVGRPQYRWNGSAMVGVGGTATGGALPTATAFAATVALDGNRDMGQYTIAGPLTFVPGPAPVNGGQNHVTLLPGTDVPDISAFNLFAHSDAYSSAYIMELYFEYINGRAYAGYLQGPAYVSVPGQVTGLVAGTPGSTIIPVSWSLPSGGAPSDYILEYRVAGATPWSVNAHSPSTALTGSFTGLLPNTPYELRVTGTNAGGNGTPSALLAVSTSATGASYVDAFNRADESPLAAPWLQLSGANYPLSLIANKVRAAAAYQDSKSIVAFGSADAKVSMEVSTGATFASGNASLLIRATNSLNYIFFQSDGANLVLFKVVAGAFTQIGATVPFAASGVFVLSAECLDSRIVCKRDGNTIFDVVESAFKTVKNFGAAAYGANPLSWQVDNFSIVGY